MVYKSKPSLEDYVKKSVTTLDWTYYIKYSLKYFTFDEESLNRFSIRPFMSLRKTYNGINIAPYMVNKYFPGHSPFIIKRKSLFWKSSEI